MTIIITLAEYKLYAGISSPNYDDKINSLLGPASLAIQSYLGYDFTSGDLTITENILLNSYQQEYLVREVLPTIVSIVWDPLYSGEYGSSIQDITGSTITLTADDYFLDDYTGMLTFLRQTPDRYRATIEYTVNKAASEDIKLAANMLLDYWRDTKNFESSVTQQGQSTSKVKVNNLPQHIEAILDPHRRL